MFAAAETSDSFLVTPDPLMLLVSLVLLMAIVAGGLVTAHKGRWGWLAIGLLSTGLIWPITALLPAVPGSRWERNRRGATPSTG